MRFQWGVLVPKAFSEADGSERWSTRTECLVDRGDGRSEQPGPESGHVVLRVRMRCLQTQRRSVEALVRGTAAEPSFVRVAGLEVDGTAHVPWDEALDQSVDLPPLLLRSAEPVTVHQAFTFGGAEETEPLAAADGTPAGRLVRERLPVDGVVRVVAAPTTRQRPVREGVRDGRERHRVGPRRRVLHGARGGHGQEPGGRAHHAGRRGGAVRLAAGPGRRRCGRRSGVPQ